MTDEQILNERERIAAISQNCLSNHLRKASRILSTFYDETLSSTGLHANQASLLVVPYLAGSISINRMSGYVGLDRTTLVRNLKLLEARGLIAIKPGEDLRTRMVTLTPAGHEALLKVLPLWEAAQNATVELLGSRHNGLMDALDTLKELEGNS